MTQHRDLADVTLQALPAELVAHVEKTWLDVHEPLPAGIADAEHWAAMADRHDAMADAYGELLDAIRGGGLLATLTFDGRQYHRDQAARARREHREQAALDQQAPVDGRTSPVDDGEFGGQAAIDEQAAERQGRELAELLAVVWRLCDEGALPAELDSLLLGEYFHLRPGGGAA